MPRDGDRVSVRPGAAVDGQHMLRCKDTPEQR